MRFMNQHDLITKLGGHGLPPLSARRYLMGLFKKAQVADPDPILDAYRGRPVTEEIVDERPESYMQGAASVIADQQAQVEQARAEANYAAQQVQGIQQQAQQQVNDLQMQLQQLGQRTQQAEMGMQQAIQQQGQSALQMAQLQSESLQAGQAAVEARQQAFDSQRALQQLQDQTMGWASQLRNMIDQNPIQQQMRAQQAAMEAQQQAAMAQQMGIPPEQMQAMQQQGQGGPPPEQGGQPTPEQAQGVQQQSQAQEQKQASQRALLKLAFGWETRQTKTAAPGMARAIRRATSAAHASGIPRMLVKAFGKRPAVVLGLSSALIGGGLGTALYFRRKREKEEMARRHRQTPVFREAVDRANLGPGRPERFSSSADREQGHGPATAGRSLRDWRPAAAWKTPKQAQFLGRLARGIGQGLTRVFRPGLQSVVRPAFTAGARGALRPGIQAGRQMVRGTSAIVRPVSGGPGLLRRATGWWGNMTPSAQKSMLGTLQTLGYGTAAALTGYGMMRAQEGADQPAQTPPPPPGQPAAPTPYQELQRIGQGQGPSRMDQLAPLTGGFWKQNAMRKQAQMGAFTGLRSLARAVGLYGRAFQSPAARSVMKALKWGGLGGAALLLPRVVNYLGQQAGEGFSHGFNPEAAAERAATGFTRGMMPAVAAARFASGGGGGDGGGSDWLNSALQSTGLRSKPAERPEPPMGTGLAPLTLAPRPAPVRQVPDLQLGPPPDRLYVPPSWQW